jgi:hypothetical protein
MAQNLQEGVKVLTQLVELRGRRPEQEADPELKLRLRKQCEHERDRRYHRDQSVKEQAE